jgi:hypothetical protein
VEYQDTVDYGECPMRLGRSGRSLVDTTVSLQPSDNIGAMSAPATTLQSSDQGKSLPLDHVR